MALNREAIAFYKTALRVAKNWKAVIESNGPAEKQFIKETARQRVKLLSSIENALEKKEYLDKSYTWLQTSLHYQIPYEKPYYYPTGFSAKRAKTFFK